MTTQPRLAYLDALRGLAAVYVAASHFAQASPAIPPHWFLVFGGFGGSAVILFFIISAFSLCMTCPLLPDGRVDTRTFYLRRLFRIAPLFWFMLALYAIGILPRFFATSPITPQAVLFDALFLTNLTDYMKLGVVAAGWTVGVEMLFYALFPLFARMNVRGALWLLGATLALAVAYRALCGHYDFKTAAWYHYNAGFIHCLPVFVLGVACFAWTKERQISRKEGAWMLAGACAGLAALILTNRAFDTLEGAYLQAPCYAALLLGLRSYPLPLFVNDVTQYLGKISFSVYLVHMPIIAALKPAYVWVGNTMGWWVHYTAIWTVSVILTAACVLAMATLTYALIERPGIALGRKLIGGIGK